MTYLLDQNDIGGWERFFSSFAHLDAQKIEEELVHNPYVSYLVYEKDHRIVGYLNYSDIYDRIEINQIEVLEEYRRQHVASILLKSLIEWAASTHKVNITLEVRCDNEAALGLYQKFGFVSKALRRGYYEGIDGILMEKEMIK